MIRQRVVTEDDGTNSLHSNNNNNNLLNNKGQPESSSPPRKTSLNGHPTTNGIPNQRSNTLNRSDPIRKHRSNSSASSTGVRAALQLTNVSTYGWKFRARRYLRRAFLGLMIFAYVFIPLFYRHCTWIRRNIIYLNAFNSIPLDALTDPVSIGGFGCARNFYFHPEENIRLGAWHIMPETLIANRCTSNGTFLNTGPDEFLDNRPVIFHLHGSAGSRASENRIKLIKILTGAKINAHVLTFDYRGFADSTPARPTVESVTRDVIALYRWLRLEKHVDNKRIFFYGQSLGTGIAIHLAHAVQEMIVGIENNRVVKLGGPAGIFLEAPYTDIAEASNLHPYTVFHTYFPWKQDCFVTPITHPDTFWDSQSRIGNVSAPVMILHAEDDDIIPYALGKRLYKLAKATRHPTKQATRMITYKAEMGYGHLAVCSDPGIPKLYIDFINEFGKF